MIAGKRILITGGAGFIGTNLTERLCESNQVVIYDNLHRNALAQSGLADHPNVTLIQGDVLDAQRLLEVARGCHQVIHMASIAGVDTVLKNPVLTMKVSLLGTVHALDAAVASGCCERFMDFSTSEVFGTYAYKVTEGDVTSLGAAGEARWTYAVSKLATEHLSLNYHKQHDLPCLSIRPFNIFGPRQVGEGAIHHFIVRALRGEDLLIHNDGSQIRAWCYITDIVDGILLAMESPEAVGRVFNIGNPRSTLTIYHLAQLIVRLAASSSSIRHVAWDSADVELRIPNIERARRYLGFQPKVELEEGLVRTVEWYRKQMQGQGHVQHVQRLKGSAEGDKISGSHGGGAASTLDQDQGQGDGHE